VVPLLAAAKARVIATAADADAEFLRSLGAIDHGYAESEYPSDVDVALNLTLQAITWTGWLGRSGQAASATITYPVPTQEWIPREDVTCISYST